MSIAHCDVGPVVVNAVDISADSVVFSDSVKEIKRADCGYIRKATARISAPPESMPRRRKREEILSQIPKTILIKLSHCAKKGYAAIKKL